ncbi:MAG: hypothetical protein JSV80_17190 [Acidobacteriota bacterium]|nr:MAG: hypothetical protein JSV80_17190 [Acidobacteriota bacterium]
MAEGEFYVGYLPAPPGLKRFVRRFVSALAVAVLAGASLVAALQRPLPSGVFEFGVQREFEGVLFEEPIPSLRVREGEGATSYLLVGFGKFGLPPFARGSHGKTVRFSGSLIYREGMTMIEMNDASSFEVLEAAAGSASERSTATIGPVTLTGELVDTKCYFGVMRPATGKIHRACAIRCLSGGVPPGLLVRDDIDDGMVFMLAGPRGAPLDFDVEWAARTVRVSGTLELHDGMPVVRVSRLALAEG